MTLTLQVHADLLCHLRNLINVVRWWPDIWNILQRSVHIEEANRSHVPHLIDLLWGESQGVAPIESVMIFWKLHLFSPFIPFLHIWKYSSNLIHIHLYFNYYIKFAKKNCNFKVVKIVADHNMLNFIYQVNYRLS